MPHGSKFSLQGGIIMAQEMIPGRINTHRVFYHDEVSLYWYAAAADGGTRGFLSEQAFLNGREGALIFKAHHTYPAFYVRDGESRRWLVAINTKLRFAFRIFVWSQPTSSEDLRSFDLKYKPISACEIPYSIQNLNE